MHPGRIEIVRNTEIKQIKIKAFQRFLRQPRNKRWDHKKPRWCWRGSSVHTRRRILVPIPSFADGVGMDWEIEGNSRNAPFCFFSSSWFPCRCRSEGVRVVSNRTTLAFFRASIGTRGRFGSVRFVGSRMVHMRAGIDHLSVPRFF